MVKQLNSVSTVHARRAFVRQEGSQQQLEGMSDRELLTKASREMLVTIGARRDRIGNESARNLRRPQRLQWGRPRHRGASKALLIGRERPRTRVGYAEDNGNGRGRQRLWLGERQSGGAVESAGKGAAAVQRRGRARCGCCGDRRNSGGSRARYGGSESTKDSIGIRGNQHYGSAAWRVEAVEVDQDSTRLASDCRRSRKEAVVVS